MPSTDAIMWAAIAGLIVAMLGVIGYLLSSGFSSIKEQFKTLWDKLDKHQTQADANAIAIASINTRCAILHANHQRATDE